MNPFTKKKTVNKKIGRPALAEKRHSASISIPEALVKDTALNNALKFGFKNSRSGLLTEALICLKALVTTHGVEAGTAELKRRLTM